jgi:carboxyl-terminal processing protease
MSLNFPDVCKTPAPPAPFVPVPYPDMGMNMQAAPFSPFVQVGFVPATNMGSLKTMTSGDEAGSMGGLVTGMIKGPGKTTVGNPIVLVTGLPAESLANPTSGNAMNAPVGVQVVPSVVNVLYTYRAEGDGAAARGGDDDPAVLDHDALLELADVAGGEGRAAREASVEVERLADGVVRLRIGLFSSQTDREVFVALSAIGLDSIRGVVLDLRGNPGGETRAALRLAEAFVPRGTALLVERDADGDEELVLARGGDAYPWPLCIAVDGGTASAAELVAAALQHAGRARVVGRSTYGKATGQRALRWPDGRVRATTVAEFLLPDGTPIDGRGVEPDVALGDVDEAGHRGAELDALGAAGARL